MDLNDKKYMMKYIVDKKLNTFLISWKNAARSTRNISLKEYLVDPEGSLKLKTILG
jgi:poly(3-hydroxyalkanoate) synthetase